MVNGCVILGCANGALKGKYSDKNVSMHAFPLDDHELCDKWVRAIRRQKFIPSKHSRLCSLHFQPSDLVEHSADTNVSRQRIHMMKNQKLTKRYLKKGAIPTIFPDASSPDSAFNHHRSTKYELNIKTEDFTSFKHEPQSSPTSDTRSSFYIVEQEVYHEDDEDLPTDLSMKSIIIKQEYLDEDEYNLSSISYPSHDPELEHWMQTEPLDLSLNKSRTH